MSALLIRAKIKCNEGKGKGKGKGEGKGKEIREQERRERKKRGKRKRGKQLGDLKGGVLVKAKLGVRSCNKREGKSSEAKEQHGHLSFLFFSFSFSFFFFFFSFSFSFLFSFFDENFRLVFFLSFIFLFWVAQPIRRKEATREDQRKTIQDLFIFFLFFSLALHLNL